MCNGKTFNVKKKPDLKLHLKMACKYNRRHWTKENASQCIDFNVL